MTESNLDSKIIKLPQIYVMYNTKKDCLSIPKILCEVYDNLFNLNVQFTKSFSKYNGSVWDDSLPILTYGGRYEKSNNFSGFFEKLTNINEYFNMGKAREIEQLIFIELHLLLTIYTFEKRQSSILQKIRKIVKFIFQPRTSLSLYFTNKKFLKTFNENYRINSLDEVWNKKIQYKNFNKKITIFQFIY
jgi:hypothetical protein